MATKREALLKKLDVKLNDLIEERNELKSRQQLFDGLKEENALLKKQYETLKMAKSLALGEKDVREARLQLSRLIRQIDNCISLLVLEDK